MSLQSMPNCTCPLSKVRMPPSVLPGVVLTNSKRSFLRRGNEKLVSSPEKNILALGSAQAGVAMTVPLWVTRISSSFRFLDAGSLDAGGAGTMAAGGGAIAWDISGSGGGVACAARSIEGAGGGTIPAACAAARLASRAAISSMM